jgi:hypothetical protein
MELLKDVDIVVGIVSLLALGIATYVNLSMKPLKEEVARHAQMLINYGQFRGMVEAMLKVNAQDHADIKKSLDKIADRLDVQANSHSNPP